MGRTLGIWALSLIFLGVIAGRAIGEPAADYTIKAAAPDGLSDTALGRPYSVNFQPLVGKEGRSVFPEAKVPIKTEASSFTYSFKEIGSSHELSANAAGWGIQVDGSSAASKRYLYYRAIQITHALELDDTSEPRVVSDAGAYYVRKIYYGRTYEVLISADASVLSGRVKADILAYSGGIAGMKAKYNVTAQIFARGLKPQASAIFATSVDEVREAYTQDPEYNAGNPVPILVEYRRIPGAALVGYSEVSWSEVAPASAAARISYGALDVDSADTDWQSSGIVVGLDDVVAVRAVGSIKIGDWSAACNPDTVGNGGLEMKVGKLTIRGGQSVVLDGQEGEVKFKVRDSKYSDNKGVYRVVVLKIPGAALKDAEAVTSPAQ